MVSISGMKSNKLIMPDGNTYETVRATKIYWLPLDPQICDLHMWFGLFLAEFSVAHF
jgi:hypothetical protein